MSLFDNKIIFPQQLDYIFELSNIYIFIYAHMSVSKISHKTVNEMSKMRAESLLQEIGLRVIFKV